MKPTLQQHLPSFFRIHNKSNNNEKKNSNSNKNKNNNKNMMLVVEESPSTTSTLPGSCVTESLSYRSVPSTQAETEAEAETKQQEEFMRNPIQLSKVDSTLSDVTQDLTEVRSSSDLLLLLDSEDHNKGMKRNKSVRFDSVQIREYPICIGDNPSSTNGPPISIGWDYESETVLTVEANEQREKRSSDHLVLSELTRMVQLHNCGYHANDITKATRTVNADRIQRQQTLDQLKWSRMEECTERIQRAVRNVTTRRYKKKQERALLKAFCSNRFLKKI